MGDNGGAAQRHATHAAQGHTRLRKSFLEKPDTLVKLPDGRTMTLGRGDKDVVPLFRKFDPKRYNAKTGKSLQRGRGKDSGVSAMPGLSFSRLVISGFLLHQAYSFLKTRFWRRGRAHPAERALALPRWDEVTEDDLDDEQRAKLAASRTAQTAMARAVLRNALPKPKRQGLPQKAAQAHAARPRQHTTAKQKMHPPNAPKPRPKGMLQRVDDAVSRQVREEMRVARQAAPAEAPALPSSWAPAGKALPASK
ncbi:hypothetical protein FOA52_011685 [Chlamydomonas sp. UWO 241]|nr:hypothetical protein FOA52_011685 [Chlamydomonas sp. UWO 241]